MTLDDFIQACEGDVMTLDDFIQACVGGAFIDYDGSSLTAGHINRDFTHVVWFNR